MFANELTREQDIKPANNYETIIVTTEGKVGLMPPLGAALNDDQAAAVISYIRRAWGRTAPNCSW